MYCDIEFGGTASNFVEVIQVGDALSPKFVFYLLYNNFHSGLVYKYQQQTTGIINFKLREYGSETVSVPESRAEQSKIAEVLSTVDRAIAQTEALIAKQQRIKTGLMQDLLTRGIDEHGQLRSEATHAFKDSPLGRIPVEWEVTTIDQIATITTGDKDTQDADANADYPFFVRSQTVERISSYTFDGEAVLTAGDGVGTGKVFHYINGRFDFHQRVYCMHTFSGGVLGYYFFCYFRGHFMERVAQFSAKGSVDSVRRHMIAKMMIPKPGADEQAEVIRILRSASRCIDDYDDMLEKLRHLKTALMQDLLTGKVRVTPLLQQAETEGHG